MTNKHKERLANRTRLKLLIERCIYALNIPPSGRNIKEQRLAELYDTYRYLLAEMER